MAQSAAPKRTDYTGVIIGAILLPVLLLFIYLGKEEEGRTVFLCLGAILFAIRVRWDLRRHFWFWVMIVLVLALHIPVLFMARWPHGRLPWIGWLPIAIADCLIVLGLFRLVERFIAKAPPAEDV